MNWDKLSNYYKKNETNILKMWNNNFEKISKTLIERAYDMEEIEILTKLSPFDLVRTNNGEEYEVVYITGNGNVAVIREDTTDDNYIEIDVEDLEKEVTLPWNCLGRIFEADSTMSEFIDRNIDVVSNIGFEIYRLPDQDSYFLGVKSVNSEALIELFTPLYLEWTKWNEEEFQKFLKEAKV